MRTTKILAAAIITATLSVTATQTASAVSMKTWEKTLARQGAVLTGLLPRSGRNDLAPYNHPTATDEAVAARLADARSAAENIALFNDEWPDTSPASRAHLANYVTSIDKVIAVFPMLKNFHADDRILKLLRAERAAAQRIAKAGCARLTRTNWERCKPLYVTEFGEGVPSPAFSEAIELWAEEANQGD